MEKEKCYTLLKYSVYLQVVWKIYELNFRICERLIISTFGRSKSLSRGKGFRDRVT